MSTNWRIGLMKVPGYQCLSWVEDAACTDPDVDPEIFFPGQGQSPEPAKRVCRRCPVINECLYYAMPKRPEPFPHGTEAGAQRHRRRNETPCLACREAAAYRSRLRKARTA